MEAVEKSWQQAAKMVCTAAGVLALSACAPFYTTPNTGATTVVESTGRGSASIDQTVILPANSSQNTIVEFRVKQSSGPDIVTRSWIDASGSGHLASVTSHGKSMQATYNMISGRAQTTSFQESQFTLTGVPSTVSIYGNFIPRNPEEVKALTDLQAQEQTFNLAIEAARQEGIKVRNGTASKVQVLCSAQPNGYAHVALVNPVNNEYARFEVNSGTIDGYVRDIHIYGTGPFSEHTLSITGNEFTNFYVDGGSGTTVQSYGNGEIRSRQGISEISPYHSSDVEALKKFAYEAAKEASKNGCLKSSYYDFGTKPIEGYFNGKKIPWPAPTP